ncbi:MAG: TetR-like C-terminal domain-containing protein, partial [Nocardioidaceae bacterium]
VVDAAVRAKGCPMPDDVNTGSLRGDLLAMSTCDGGLTDNVPMAVLSGIVTAMQHDPALRQTFQAAFLGPRVAMMQVVFDRARERGELATGVDIAQIWDVLPAVFIHRACVLGEPPSADLVTRIVDHVVLPAAGVTAAGASS